MTPTRSPLGAGALALAALLSLAGCSALSVRSTPAPDVTEPAAPAASTMGASTGVPTTAAATVPAPTTGCPQPSASFVTKAPGDGRTVALTFDDGPAPADAQIAAVLARYGVHATFFETGQHAQADPATVSMLAAQGHLIAGHSWDHQYPSAVPGGWTVSYLAGQLTRTDALLGSLSGNPVCYFRPPGGHKDNVLAAAGAQGLTSVMWSIDTEDWAQPSTTSASATARIVAAATATSSQTHPIVLMHSGKASHEPDSEVSPNRGNTVAALPAVIEWYSDHGYTFVRLDGSS